MIETGEPPCELRKFMCPTVRPPREQRREIVKGIHGVINGVEKRPSAAQTYVLIKEVEPGDWGNAGNVYPPGN